MNNSEIVSTEDHLTAAPNQQNKVTQRRRSGRRVTRGAGAAGKQVALTVEEVRGATPTRDASESIVVQQGESEVKQVSLRTRKRVVRNSDNRVEAKDQVQPRESFAKDRHDDTSMNDARSQRSPRTQRETRRETNSVDMLQSPQISSRNREHTSLFTYQDNQGANEALSTAQSAAKTRSITSLLFQEPVLPAYHASSADAENRYDTGSARGKRASSLDVNNQYDDREDRSATRQQDRFRDEEDDNQERVNRKRNRRQERVERANRSRAHVKERSHSQVQQHDDDSTENEQINHDTRRVRGDRTVTRNENRDEDNASLTTRLRRNRRLNAAERRAAAEVEQIEEDLEYDDIVYAPINERNDTSDIDVDELLAFETDDDLVSDRDNNRSLKRLRRSRVESSNDAERSDDDEQEAQRSKTDDDDNGDVEGETVYTRRRRRRRNSRNAERSDEKTDSYPLRDEDDSDLEDVRNVSQEDRDLIPDPEQLRQQDEEETLYTRRRRRRRNKNNNDESTNERTVLNDNDADNDHVVARRSRKQQYIDEIADIEGSTRLEAKRQRRRDNRRERRRQSMLMEQDFLARREHVERLMVVRERDRHTQISVIEDNILVEHYVSDIQEVATVGNIYLGRVQNVLPSMEAAFVDIGQVRNGVLYAGEVNWDTTRLEGQPRRIELAFKTGDPVLVQVTKDPIGHKGARLTSQVTLAGRFLVLVPSGGMTGVSRKLSDSERSRLRSIVNKVAPKDMGVIIRTAADGASEEAITKDLASLIHQWERIEAKRQEFLHGKRPKLLQGEPDVAIRVVRDIFNDDFLKLMVEGEDVYRRINEYLDVMAPDLLSKVEYYDPAEHDGKDVFDKWQIDSQLRKGMERQVYLPSGGSIVIDRTEAMTTIDVNTGRFIGRGKSLEETVTRCNLEASEEIARQLRLRDIGGMVMIDYVDMVLPANRDLVLRRLVECLARDRTKHQVAEVTSLGLVQMTRKRVGQGLVEAFSEECPTCRGRGFIVHDEPTVSAQFADPYALKGGDPFVKTNKYGYGTAESATKPVSTQPHQQGSSADVRATLARIAAASVTNTTDSSELKESELTETSVNMKSGEHQDEQQHYSHNNVSDESQVFAETEIDHAHHTDVEQLTALPKQQDKNAEHHEAFTVAAPLPTGMLAAIREAQDTSVQAQSNTSLDTAMKQVVATMLNQYSANLVSAKVYGNDLKQNDPDAAKR